MKVINNLQKSAVYVFFFSLNFESMNLFNLNIDYLASKISASMLLAFFLINLKVATSSKYFYKYIKPLIYYFVLLTVMGIINISNSSDAFFYFSFFLNILIFNILINFSINNPNILLKGLFILGISTFIISLLYFMGIGITIPLEGRPTVFEINQNYLGLSICISIFVFYSIIFENKFQYGKIRYFLLLLLPFLFISMISSGSRIAFLSFILGIIMFLFFKNNISPLKRSLIISGLIIVAILFWQFYIKTTFLVERLSNTVNYADSANRDLIWLQLFDTIINNPIWGVGRTGLINEFGEGSPHNVIIEVLCYTGIVGLIIFSVFIIRIIRNVYRRYKYNGETLPIILSIPIFGFILTGQILEQKVIWVVLAYMTGVWTGDLKIGKREKLIKKY